MPSMSPWLTARRLGIARSFFELDDERRAVITEVEELQATRNAESKKIGALMREGKRTRPRPPRRPCAPVNEKIDGSAERRTAPRAGAVRLHGSPAQHSRRDATPVR